MRETIHLQLLLATFAAWSGRQQAKLITYLIEEDASEAIKGWKTSY